MNNDVAELQKQRNAMLLAVGLQPPSTAPAYPLAQNAAPEAQQSGLPMAKKPTKEEMFSEYQKTKRGQDAMMLVEQDFEDWLNQQSSTPPSTYDLMKLLSDQGKVIADMKASLDKLQKA